MTKNAGAQIAPSHALSPKNHPIKISRYTSGSQCLRDQITKTPEMTWPPKTWGKGYKLWVFACYIRVVFLSIQIFFKEGEISARIIYGEDFPWAGKFPRMNLQRGISHGRIYQNYTKFFLLSLCRFDFSSRNVPVKLAWPSTIPGGRAIALWISPNFTYSICYLEENANFL